MSILDNIKCISEKIREAELLYRRPQNTVRLLAVSKGQSLEKIKVALDAGLTAFGENYFQEAYGKIKALPYHQIEWHFIGAIQSNKSRGIAENFSWVHSISRISEIEWLNQYRPDTLPPLNVCIQVNVDKVHTKLGTSPEIAEALALKVSEMPRLKLRGLMAFPAPYEDFQTQYELFKRVALLQEQLLNKAPMLDTLSMGTSQDFVAAIAAGSTIVRIGESIFGKR